jgi:hypothetical protein
VTYTLGIIPLDEGSALCRDLYVTTQNTYKTQTSMAPAGFEPAISEIERPQTYSLDSAASGICQKRRHIYTNELCRLKLIHTRNVLISCDFRDWYSVWNSIFVLFNTKGLYFSATWLRIEVSSLLGSQSYTERRTRTEITAVPCGGIVNHLLKIT